MGKRHRRVAPRAFHAQQLSIRERQWRALVAQVPPAIRPVVRRMREERPDCLLCGHTPEMLGIFQPAKPEAWGAPAGATRVIGYALCRRCQARPDVTLAVEARIQRALVGQSN
jgi:hypothetical protein